MLGSPDILYVIGGLDIGGTENHLKSVSRRLKQIGWTVCVYSLAGDGPLKKEIEEGGATVIVPPIGRRAISNATVFRALRIMVAWLHLICIMLRLRPRVVHFFLPAAYLVGGIAAYLTRIRICVMSRRSLNFYQRSYLLLGWFEKWLHHRMKAVLGNSMAVVTQLHAEELVPVDKLGLIYNGIEAPKLRADVRQLVRAALGIDDQTIVFIIVANLIPYKGHSDLLAAFERASGSIGRPWRLLIVGRDDGVGSKLRQQAKQLGIERHVGFLGVRTDVASLLSASDVGVLCSHQEGFSNAILEGMAAGLPMIVTDVGGNAEAVRSEQTGLVVPPKAPDALAAALVTLARDPGLRRTYGEAGRRRFELRFELDRCVASYDALYKGLLKGNSPLQIPEVCWSE